MQFLRTILQINSECRPYNCVICCDVSRLTFSALQSANRGPVCNLVIISLILCAYLMNDKTNPKEQLFPPFPLILLLCFLEFRDCCTEYRPLGNQLLENLFPSLSKG